MADPQDSEGLEKEEIKEFLPDAYLLDYIENILQLKSAFNNPVDNTGGTYFASKHTINTSFESKFNEIFVKLAGRSDMKQFGELTGLNIAGLHPRIKLYRIDQSEGGVKKKREFVFNYGTSMNPSTEIFESSQFMGGAGIKSLSYTLAGTNPAEAERAIDVSITFAFQSVNDFIGFTSGGKSGLQQLIEFRKDEFITNSKYAGLEDKTDNQDKFGTKSDLVSQTFNYLSLIERPSSVPNEYNARNFEIVAEIGYSVNQSTEVVPEQLRKRIEGMNLNLVLNLINHELTFTEEGSLELKVNYYGSLQQYMNDPKTDYFSIAFESDEKFKQKKNEVDDLQAQVKDLSDQIRKKCDQSNLESNKEKLKKDLETLKTRKEEQKEINNDVRSNIYSSFIGKLYEKTLLYSFTIPKESVTAWTKYINDPETNPVKPVFPIKVIGIPTKPNDDFKEAAAEAAKEEPSAIDSKIEDMRNKKIEPDKEYAMYYFYFGDLLQNITQVYEVGNTNNRIILGDIEFEDPRNLGTFFKFNLGEIPINLQLFQSWFLEKIVKPKKLSYRLDNMIRDLINGLLRPALDTEVIFTNADKKIDVKVDLSFTNFSIQTDKNKEPINDKNLIDYYGVIENNISNFSTTKNNTPHYYNYFVIYSKVAFCSLKGNQIEDEKNGIMHLYVGRNVGPVTSIKFKRIDQPYNKEAKATREGFTPLSSLRDIYNVDVGMIGNHFFYPGMNVFIHPPVSFGNPVDKNKSLANIMGIGGYYSIIKVNSVIDAGGKYETSLDCYWQSFGDGCGDLTIKCK
jgi:hypothetical protein